MVLSAKLPFTTELHYVLSQMMDTLYAVRHTKKNINFGGRQNRIQNQDGAPTICVITKSVSLSFHIYKTEINYPQ